MSGIHNQIISYFKNTENPIILDIGSYRLEDSLIFSNLFPQSKIWAFECDFRNLETIKKVKYPFNICVVPYAVCDKDGKTEFWLSETLDGDKDYYLSNSIHKPERHLIKYPISFFNTPIYIQCCKLDTWIENNILNEPIELAWVDLNGGEGEFINGFRKHIHNLHLLWIEAFEDPLYENQVDVNWIKNELTKLGFKYILQNDHNYLFQNENIST